jgi:penicillin-binding protein 1A
MSRRQRHRRRNGHHNGTSIKRMALLALSIGVVLALVGVLSVVGYIIGVAASAPSISSLKPIDHGATSSIYAANGKRLGFITSDELRTPVATNDMPRFLHDATVAVEDRRFYRHKGIDYEGVVRAGVENLRSGKTVQGGSTITMQLVRNLYISDKQRTFQRKIREAKLAEEIENEHSKTWILTQYLNNVPYGTVGGATAVGAAAAARVFFNKPVQYLKLHEAALLAGLPQAPSIYNPFRDPRSALRRRNDVLNKMANLGMITRPQAESAKRRGLGVKANTYYSSRRESYFFDYVKQELIQRYGINTVRKGGLKVYTTIDLNLQREARRAITNTLPYSGDPSSAIVSIDPRTGYIRAMASSGSYGQNKYNYAAQGRRQPGSAFKTFVLMTALRRGVDPKSTFYTSKPLNLNTEYGPWKVKTYSGSYGGSMSLVEATLQSDNTVYAQLDLDLGPDAVRQTARDMGITTRLDALPAEGLGGLTLGVSPLEMAVAYATIASGGWRNKPVAIRKVVFPDGKTEELGKPKRRKVFSDGIAHEAQQILQQNIRRGTGTKASIGCPAGGKTGTTDDFTDAWFVGFTPRLTTSVWVGYPNASVEMRGVHGIDVNGGSFPAQIWGDYMSVAKGSTCSDFPRPNEPASFRPFFGRFARGGGGRGSGSYSYGGGSDYGVGRYGGGAYEAPPQAAPQVQAPSAPPGGGGGGGGGGGRNGGGGGAGPGGGAGGAAGPGQ